MYFICSAYTQCANQNISRSLTNEHIFIKAIAKTLITLGSCDQCKFSRFNVLNSASNVLTLILLHQTHDLVQDSFIQPD